MKDNHIKQLSGLLLATLFISTSGVLGKYIAMPSEVIAWFRSAFALVFLYAFCRYKKIPLKVQYRRFIGLVTVFSFAFSFAFNYCKGATNYRIESSNYRLGAHNYSVTFLLPSLIA